MFNNKLITDKYIPLFRYVSLCAAEIEHTQSSREQNFVPHVPSVNGMAGSALRQWILIRVAMPQLFDHERVEQEIPKRIIRSVVRRYQNQSRQIGK